MKKNIQKEYVYNYVGNNYVCKYAMEHWIKGHGGSMRIYPSGIVIIKWIYGKNVFQLFIYNMILLFIHCFRKEGRKNVKNKR